MTKTEEEFLSGVMPGVDQYAKTRIYSIIKKNRNKKFKLNRDMFKGETYVSRLVGEMAGLERVICYMENNPDADLDEIKGFIQIGIVALNNKINQLINTGQRVEIEDFFNGKIDYKVQ